jgi:Tfp pilus assembly protein PilO
MNKRLALVGGLALVVVLLIWNMAFFGPAGSDVDKAQARNDEAAQQQQNKKRELERLQSHPPNQTETQAQLAKLQAAIPPEPALASFIRSAYEIKAQSGVDWVSIQPSPPTAGGLGPSEIKMQVVVRGGFFQVLDYLTRLQTLPRIVVVGGINVQTAGSNTSGGGSSSTPTTTTGSSGAPNLNVTLNASMYTQAPPAGGSTSATGPTTGVPPRTGTTPTVPSGAATTPPTNPGAAN